MKIVATALAGVFVIQTDPRHDERGMFVKVFHQGIFLDHRLTTNFQESYYSTSKKDVVRGMHFQTPPADHAKLVYVTHGAILDVILDIRKGSPSFGQFISVELSDQNYHAIYVPSGFAHGFLSLQDDSCVTYMQTSMYAPEYDAGIRFDSFGMQWGVEQPILSPRDHAFPSFDQFTTPFIYKKDGQQ